LRRRDSDASAMTAHAGDGGERVLFEGRPALLPTVGAWLLTLLTVGLALIGYWLKQRKSRYKLTSQRVVVEHGIFSQRMEQVDLYRIKDYVVERPFWQRLVGNGNLIVETSDTTTPRIHLRALPVDVVALYEALRQATEAEKARRGVRVVDYE
jgi:uncharacterized membrane protein YdbT with pleckstrin-like domain